MMGRRRMVGEKFSLGQAKEVVTLELFTLHLATFNVKFLIRCQIIVIITFRAGFVR
jgi:hypothetical protein